MYYTGGRVNEIIQLKKSDIVNKKLTFRAETTKRKKERFVIIPNVFLKVLKEYMSSLTDDDVLFKLTSQRVWQLSKQYTKKAGINKDIHPHSFRHTYATELYHNTGDLKLVQELLGHSDIASTSIYAHVSEEKKAEEINKAFK